MIYQKLYPYYQKFIPNVKMYDKIIWDRLPITIAFDGIKVFPKPRIIEANIWVNQKKIENAKKTFA